MPTQEAGYDSMSEKGGQLKRALEDADDASRQVSTNNRYISFGLVAISFTMLSSDAHFVKAIVHAHGLWVLLVGASGCAGVIFDYFHYFNAERAADRASRNQKTGYEYQYGDKWPAVIWRERFYTMRTWTAMAGAILLIALIGWSWFTLGSATL